MSPHADDDFLSQNLPPNLPAVLLNSGVRSPTQPVFAVDNFGGARAMTEHLVGIGRRRIAFLGGPAANFEARERERGYRAGLGAGSEPWLLEGDFSEGGGQRAGAALLALPASERPDAVFAANDIMAIGLLGTLLAGGVRIPQDMALAGFDDIPIARYVSPALTTMRVPIAALGSQALDALADTLESHPADPSATVMPVQLVVRRSCGSTPP
jgi:LacI family transcriptional regulator